MQNIQRTPANEQENGRKPNIKKSKAYKYKIYRKERQSRYKKQEKKLREIKI